MKNFCEHCRDVVEYTIKIEKKKTTIRSKTIEYNAKVAYCCECHKEIFVAELRDDNLKELDKAFRSEEGLIQASEIHHILNKYDIGKRPLSILLGWGELTLSRYVEGDTPTKPYSDTLKLIMENEQYYCDLVEKNKNRISDTAYKKTIKAANNSKITVVANANKLDSVIRYLLIKNTDITALALQKLLYLSQGFFKAFTGEFMFKEDCEAWIHGPVYPSVYRVFKSYGYRPLNEIVKEYPNEIEINLDKDEIALLDSISDYFGCYSGKVLEEFTHNQQPWIAARKGLSIYENSERVVDKEIISQYFIDIKKQYNMKNYLDIKRYSNDLFSALYE